MKTKQSSTGRRCWRGIIVVAIGLLAFVINVRGAAQEDASPRAKVQRTPGSKNVRFPEEPSRRARGAGQARRITAIYAGRTRQTTGADRPASSATLPADFQWDDGTAEDWHRSQ